MVLLMMMLMVMMVNRSVTSVMLLMMLTVAVGRPVTGDVASVVDDVDGVDVLTVVIVGSTFCRW